MIKLQLFCILVVLLYGSCVRFVEVDKTIRKVSASGQVIEVNIQRLKAWDKYYCTKIAREVYDRRDRIKSLLDSFNQNGFQASKESYLIADTIHLTFPVDSNYMIIKFQVFKGFGAGWLNRDRKFRSIDGNNSEFIECYNEFFVELESDIATNLYKHLPKGLFSQSSTSFINYYPADGCFYSDGHFAFLFNGDKEEAMVTI